MYINEIFMEQNDTVLLYRGDSSKIAQFSTDASTTLVSFLLYGNGIYLTDNPEIAIDYSLKSNKSFGEDQDVFPTREIYISELDLYKAYLKHDIEKNTTWLDEFNTLKTQYQNNVTMIFNNDPNLSFDERKSIKDKEKTNFINKTKPLFAKYLEKAKTKFNQSNLETFKKTTGEWVIIKPSHVSVVSHFSIPKSYLDNTFPADSPMNNKEMNFIYNAIDSVYKGNGDFRDKDNNLVSFRDWVSLYRNEGVHRAYSDDKYNPDVIGGEGLNPTLGNVINDTFIGKHRFDEIKKIMLDYGYVGINYQGGVRQGSIVRGGGGVLHTSYVLWDDDYVNSKKIISEFPPFKKVDNSKLKQIDDLE